MMMIAKRLTHLDLVLAVHLVVVQRILRVRRRRLVVVLDEGDVLLRRHHTHFVEVGVSTSLG